MRVYTAIGLSAEMNISLMEILIYFGFIHSFIHSTRFCFSKFYLKAFMFKQIFIFRGIMFICSNIALDTTRPPPVSVSAAICLGNTTM